MVLHATCPGPAGCVFKFHRSGIRSFRLSKCCSRSKKTISRCTPDAHPDAKFLSLPNGEKIAYPSRPVYYPRLELSRLQAVELQLKALQENDKPHYDHGIEVLYRFSACDPWSRSKYFGMSLDLGQFERFRRMMITEQYGTLLCLENYSLLSSLEVSDTLWKQRVLVTGTNHKEERTYEFTMVQRVGGSYDGVWYTQSILCDPNQE